MGKYDTQLARKKRIKIVNKKSFAKTKKEAIKYLYTNQSYKVIKKCKYVLITKDNTILTYFTSDKDLIGYSNAEKDVEEYGG